MALFIHVHPSRWSITFAFALLFLVFCNCEPKINERTDPPIVHRNISSQFVEKWLKLEENFAESYTRFANDIMLPMLRETYESVNVSQPCRSSLEILMSEYGSLQKWAVQVVDSSGKIASSGLLEGSVSYLGRFDECLQIDKRINEHRIKGQYCSLLVRPILPTRPKFKTICNHIPIEKDIFKPETMFDWLAQNAHYFYYVPIRVGLCSPSTCSPGEVFRISEKVLQRFHLESELLGETCSIQDDTKMDRAQLFVTVLFCFYAALVFVASAVDFGQIRCRQSSREPEMDRSKQDLTKSAGSSIASSSGSFSKLEIHAPRWARFLTCFSFQRNVANLLNIDHKPSKSPEDSLGHVHGLRILTMAWIILGHTFGLVNHSNYTQSFSSEKLYTNVVFQALLNATVNVDTFFFLSGFLAFYVTWQKIKNGWKLNPLKYVLLRYARLTPALLAAIGLAIVFPLLGKGPLWKETVLPMSENCYSSWWTNILYINNLVKSEKICLMHSWYLSNDFQFHMIGLFCFAVFIRSKGLGIVCMALAIVSATVVTAIQVVVNNYPPTIVTTSPATPERWQFILDFYYKPWPHLPSYYIGMIAGYIMTVGDKIQFGQMSKIFLAVFSFASTLFALYGVQPWNRGDDVNLTYAAIYGSIFRTLWTINCAIWVLVLSRQRKGSIYKCLSWKGFIPASRLTYTAYLVHPFVIWYYYGTTREPITGLPYPMFHNFLAFYTLTYLCALISGVLFESPFVSIIRIAMQSRPEKCPPKIKKVSEPPVAKLFGKSGKVELPVTYEQLKVIVRRDIR